MMSSAQTRARLAAMARRLREESCWLLLLLHLLGSYQYFPSPSAFKQRLTIQCPVSRKKIMHQILRQNAYIVTHSLIEQEMCGDGRPVEASSPSPPLATGQELTVRLHAMYDRICVRKQSRYNMGKYEL